MLRSLYVGLFIYIVVPVAAAMPDLNDAIRADIEDLIARDEARAVVVGLYENGERRVVPFGALHRDRHQSPDGDTLFEMGSVSKVFTALLAQSQVDAGRLTWDTTIGEQLAEVDFASDAVAGITLRELASHTSGLPRIPDNMEMQDPLDPYAGYDREDLLAFLAGFAPDALVKQYDYSNLGAGLLGVIAADAAGLSYTDAMRRDVFRPVQLDDTWISVPQNARNRLAVGFSQGADMPNWSGFNALAGAGAIVSTVNEMLDFIEQNVEKSEMDGLLAAIRKPEGNGETALGWHIRDNGGSKVYWHNGGTGGYASILLLQPDKQTGVVILTTSTAYNEVTALGFSQLADETVAADDSDLSVYTGTYRITEGFLLSIFERGGRLSGQATGQGEFPLDSGGEHEFANSAADIRIVFSAFEDGLAQTLTLIQGGRTTVAPRVAAAMAARPRDVIDVDASTLQQFTGQYELMPEVIITVESRDAQLYAQLTGQLAYPVFAYDPDRFFFKVVDAQLEFERDDDGKVIAVILHQAGQQRAPRL